MAELAALATVISTAAPALAELAPIAGLAGTGASVVGTLAGGASANAAAKFEAEQLKQQAAAERAAGQRQAMERRKEGELVRSRIIARSAASGGGTTTDATILDLIEDVSGRSEFLAQTDYAMAENRARGALDQATAARMKGKNKRAASILDAVGTGLTGFSKTYG